MVIKLKLYTTGHFKIGLSIMETKIHKSKFVIIASIATEITKIINIAKELSLAAGNAKAIAYRAGDKAKGFQPITDFINELAKETLMLVNDINNNAYSLYNISIEEYRIKEAIKGINKVNKLIGNKNQQPYYYNSLESFSLTLNKELMYCSEDLDIKVKELLDQLDGIMRPARAARVIAANSRIEASQADEYLQSLQGVAESVDKAAQVIYDSVQRSQRTLSMINHLD